MRISTMSPDLPIYEEYLPQSSKLYLIFGGFAGGLGIPPFEFFNSSRIIPENKIFLRDFSQSWYQNGLPGIGKDFFAIGDFIEKKIAHLKPQNVFFVGNSMGGYASILFASLVGMGTAIAFSPQTFISPVKRWHYADNRWAKQIWMTYLKTGFKKHIWDLGNHLSTNNPAVRIDIFVSKNDRLDLIHAHELRKIKSVNIYEFESGGHELVKRLRDEGKLPDILLGIKS